MKVLVVLAVFLTVFFDVASGIVVGGLNGTADYGKDDSLENIETKRNFIADKILERARKQERKDKKTAGVLPSITDSVIKTWEQSISIATTDRCPSIQTLESIPILHILGLDRQFLRGVELVHNTPDWCYEPQDFPTAIKILAPLVSSYQVSKNAFFLDRIESLVMRLVDLYPAHDQICADCDAQVEDIVDSWMPIEALFAILPSPATEHLKCVSESTVSLLNGWSILQTQEFPNSKMILEMALWKRQQGEVQSEDRSPCVDDDVLAIGFNGLDRNSKKKSPIDTCASAEILSEKLQRRSVVGETVEEIHASAAQYGQHQRQAHDWSKKCYRALLQKIQKRAPKNAIVETAAQLLRTLLHLWQDTAEDTFRSSALNVHQLMQTYTDKNKVEAGIIVLPVFAIVTGNTTKSQIQSLHRDHWVLSASGLPYSIVISGVKKQCYSGDLDEVMQRKTLHHPCRSEDLHTNVYNQEMPADFEEFIPTLDLSAPGGSALFQGKHSFQDYEDERARSHVQDERDGVMSKESIIKETMDTIKNDFEVLAQRRGDTEEPQSVADMVIADLEAQFFEAQRMKARSV